MKKQLTLIANLLLIFVLFFGSAAAVCAQADEPEYIPYHTQEELVSLFTQVKAYLDENGETLMQQLDDTQSRVVTSAFIRSWAIAQYEDPYPWEIDNAYEALYNMTLFLGLATDPEKSFSTGMLFEYAVQLLDQDYYDLLEAAGEDPDNIEYAAYLRDIAEALVEDPESFTAEEVEDYLLEIYEETYYAAGLKAIAYTETLPLPEELFGEEDEGSAMMPNPMVEYTSADPLNDMLGIEMPELPEDTGASLGYYSIIADIVAEIEYEFQNGELLVFRLAPEADLDISGVYGSNYYDDWLIAGTPTEIDTYGDMFIAWGTLETMDGTPYSFAVDSEGIDEESFYTFASWFIESCVNQRAAY